MDCETFKTYPLFTLSKENRGPEEIELLEHLAKQHLDLALLMDLAHQFLQLVRQRQANAFDSWLMKALTCQIKPLQKFAAGLMEDYAVVKACMMTEVSNGPVEGLNNKLKMRSARCMEGQDSNYLQSGLLWPLERKLNPLTGIRCHRITKSWEESKDLDI